MHRSLLLLRLDECVFQHDFRSLCRSSDGRCGGRSWLGIRGRNLRIGVVGAVQLGRGLRLEFKPRLHGISLSFNGSFRLTMKSAILASLASWVTATLICEAVAAITIPGTGVCFPCSRLQSLSASSLEPNARIVSLSARASVVRSGVGHDQIVNLLLRALCRVDMKVRRREKRALCLLLDRIQAVQAAVVFLVVILELRFDLRL